MDLPGAMSVYGNFALLKYLRQQWATHGLHARGPMHLRSQISLGRNPWARR